MIWAPKAVAYASGWTVPHPPPIKLMAYSIYMKAEQIGGTKSTAHLPWYASMLWQVLEFKKKAFVFTKVSLY